MLPNAYFLAKFRFDAAENEPAKNLQNLLIFPILLTLLLGEAHAPSGGRSIGSFAREEPEEVEGVGRAEFRQR